MDLTFFMIEKVVVRIDGACGGVAVCSGGGKKKKHMPPTMSKLIPLPSLARPPYCVVSCCSDLSSQFLWAMSQFSGFTLRKEGYIRST